MSRLSLEEMKRKGEVAKKFYEEWREDCIKEGSIVEHSFIAKSPTLPQKTGNGVRASVSYSLRRVWFQIHSWLYWLFAPVW